MKILSHWLSMLFCVPLLSGCGGMEFLPPENSYTAKNPYAVPDKDKNYGTLYLSVNPTTAQDNEELFFHVARKDGRYKAYTPLWNEQEEDKSAFSADVEVSKISGGFFGGITFKWKFGISEKDEIQAEANTELATAEPGLNAVEKE